MSAFATIGLFYQIPDVYVDQFLACFGFWVKNLKVKSKTESLGFDLVVCRLEKVTPIKKPLN